MKSFFVLLEEYKRYIKGLGYADGTQKSYVHTLKQYHEYLRQTGNEDVRRIALTDINAYLGHLQKTESKAGKPYSKRTLYRITLCLRSFFTYLHGNDYLLTNPAESLSARSFLTYDKNRGLFTEAEINTFLDSISLNEVFGQRDRTLFELMYSSALRIGDVAALNTADVDMKERVLTIRQGKGSKDAYVPFSETAQMFLQKYLRGERNRLMKKARIKERGALFFKAGGRITKAVIWNRFKKILEQAGIEKKNRSVHSIRHSTATHLLEAGADIKYVSELLRHDNLETTARYTHLTSESIKRAYKSAHPRENKYYEEITEEYLAELDKLIEELKRKWRILD